jgi:hypothetical protein
VPCASSFCSDLNDQRIARKQFRTSGFFSVLNRICSTSILARYTVIGICSVHIANWQSNRQLILVLQVETEIHFKQKTARRRQQQKHHNSRKTRNNRNTSRKYTVICFLWVSAKFSTCTVVRVNGTLVEDKMRRFKGECEHFSFNKCVIYTHDGASAKFSTNSQWKIVKNCRKT